MQGLKAGEGSTGSTQSHQCSTEMVHSPHQRGFQASRHEAFAGLFQWMGQNCCNEKKSFCSTYCKKYQPNQTKPKPACIHPLKHLASQPCHLAWLFSPGMSTCPWPKPMRAEYWDAALGTIQQRAWRKLLDSGLFPRFICKTARRLVLMVYFLLSLLGNSTAYLSLYCKNPDTMMGTFSSLTGESARAKEGFGLLVLLHYLSGWAVCCSHPTWHTNHQYDFWMLHAV